MLFSEFVSLTTIAQDNFGQFYVAPSESNFKSN